MEKARTISYAIAKSWRQSFGVEEKKESMVSSLSAGALAEFQTEGAIFNFSLDLWMQILSMY